jgi:hypothetical protein
MKQTLRESGTTKQLCHSLNRRLNVYALAANAAGAGLLAMPQPLQAEVVFTPAQITLSNGPLAIDLNNDGAVDFILSNNSVGGGCCFYTRKLDVTGGFVGSSQNSIEGLGTNAVALEAGAVVGPHDLFLAAPLNMATAFNDSNSFFFIFGPFANKRERFLGLRFTINGENHYGWAEFRIVRAGFSGSKPIISATLSGYAYETVPNRPLVAGVAESVSDGSAAPSDASPSAAGPQPATLGLLALGSPGLSVWRRKEPMFESN